MKIARNYIAILLFLITATLPSVTFSQIIADHTVVADFDKIPLSYLNEVKKMWVILAGESHSKGYRIGCQLLENSNPEFQVGIMESGTPEGYTDQYMRLSRATWGDVNNSSNWIYSYGEEDWFTSPLAISRTKNHLTWCNTHDLQIAAMGFGWCWDMTSSNWPGGTVDPFYQVRWAGASVGGPEGSLRWGLDDEDQVLTGNSVSMDSYLNATADYISHCEVNSYPTKMFFTTGPVDGSGNVGENGYQRSIKHQYIRDFVGAAPDRILFDYADILCWSDAGNQKNITWTDFAGNQQTYQVIHDDNLLDLDGGYTEDGDHIGQRGALRLAKALWWMLARMAGWDGSSLGINQPTEDNQILIYPNPVVDVLTIAINQNSNRAYHYVTLSDTGGREIIKTQLENPTTKLNLEGLASGVYILNLKTEKEVVFMEIVKQ